MKTTVADLLNQKGQQVHTISPDATVFDAIGTMVEHNVGSLIVAEGPENVAGIVTERDYLRRVALQGRSSRSTRVAEIMTAELVVVGRDTDLEQCMAIMTERRIRHLPVIDGTRLVGVISVGDVVKHLSAEREAEIRLLTDYIAGPPYPG